MDTYGAAGSTHKIAANEGAAAALAAGYHIATGKVPVVYLQNSGLGNIVNPLLSLLHPEVYAIPCIFVIGWRGEPGLPDEPQHRAQGTLTEPLLETLGVPVLELTKEMAAGEISGWLAGQALREGRQCAILVREGALSYEKRAYQNAYTLRREAVLDRLLDAEQGALFVATTGKTGRELFDLREARGEGHDHDFLTVGSMGHASAIALGLAEHAPGRRIVCLDGDGAALMHMGTLATIAKAAPRNFLHVVLNNEAHESVGGAPTTDPVDFATVARALGYPRTLSARTEEELSSALRALEEDESLALLEVKVAIGSRKDLGRPTTTPQQNKEALQRELAEDLEED